MLSNASGPSMLNFNWVYSSSGMFPAFNCIKIKFYNNYSNTANILFNKFNNTADYCDVPPPYFDMMNFICCWSQNVESCTIIRIYLPKHLPNIDTQATFYFLLVQVPQISKASVEYISYITQLP